MKREALSHPKMLHLASLLECNRAQAVGYVTLLIDWVAAFATEGDVGKWPNGAIARGSDWTDSPDIFIEALIASGWLDTHPTYRLVLHDWPDHAERWVKSKLVAENRWFLDHYNAPRKKGRNTSRDTSPDTSRDTSGDPPRDQTKPNLLSVSESESEGAVSESEREEFETVPELREAQGRIIPPRPAGKLSHSVFGPLREEHLGDTKALVEWHAKQLGALEPVCGPTEAHLLCVIAAGLHASEMPPGQVKKSRLAVFKHVVRNRRWKSVRGYIPTARDLLDDYQQRKEVCDPQEATATG